MFALYAMPLSFRELCQSTSYFPYFFGLENHPKIIFLLFFKNLIFLRQKSTISTFLAVLLWSTSTPPFSLFNDKAPIATLFLHCYQIKNKVPTFELHFHFWMVQKEIGSIEEYMCINILGRKKDILQKKRLGKIKPSFLLSDCLTVFYTW